MIPLHLSPTTVIERPYKIQRPYSAPGFRPVMFGTMIYPNSSTNDSTNQAVVREYSGSTTAATNTPPNIPQTCSQILNTEQLQGKIQPGESCSCPPGATQPVCVQPTDYCTSMINQIENTPNGKYEQCVCASPNSGFPVCTPYYQLCENNLPQYQTQYNTCSCQNPQTTAQPYCESYYQICINNLNAAMASNPNQQCYCPDPATASQQQPQCQSDYSICMQKAVQEEQNNMQCTCSQTSPNPTCETDYQICEQNAQQYENSNTTCTCSQTSVNPYCCTKNTTQQCTQTQQCHNSVSGYACSSSPSFIICPSLVQCAPQGCWVEIYGATIPYVQGPKGANYCNGATPICINDNSTNCISGWDAIGCSTANAYSPTTSYSQQCTQVTTCNPTTTTSCATE